MEQLSAAEAAESYLYVEREEKTCYYGYTENQLAIRRRRT
jgi:hypothetical protein